MDIIFQGHETHAQMFSRITDHVNAGKAELREGAPIIIHYKNLSASDLIVQGHPGFAADLITAAWSCEAFEDHKAVVHFDSDGITHIFITDEDVVEIPKVYNMAVEGSA